MGLGPTVFDYQKHENIPLCFSSQRLDVDMLSHRLEKPSSHFSFQNSSFYRPHGRCKGEAERSPASGESAVHFVKKPPFCRRLPTCTYSHSLFGHDIFCIPTCLLFVVASGAPFRHGGKTGNSPLQPP